MVTTFVRHAVADYEVWKRGYDAFAPFQKENGVSEEKVLQDLDGCDTQEWIGQQSWSNGKAGMSGASYLGIGQ